MEHTHSPELELDAPRSSLVLLALHWKWTILSSFILVWYARTYYSNGLYRIPGPPLRSISVIPRLLSVYKGQSHQDDLNLHRRYGRIVRTAPNQLSISDPNGIKKIYGTGTQFVKSPFYSLSETHDDQGLIPDPFILKDMRLHSYMKRNASNAYAMHGLMQMEGLLEPVEERLLDILRALAKEGREVDMGRQLRNYTMDAVTAITFGKDYNYLRNGDTLSLHRVGELASGYMAIFGQIPWSHKFLLSIPWIANLVLPTDVGSDILGLVEKEVQSGRDLKEESATLTFLQRLLLNQQQHPEQISDRDITTHTFGNVMAGSDTTAIALQSIILNILKHPQVYKRLCGEIRSEITGLPVPYSRASALPYLNDVIKEAIRLCPSVGMMLARTVPPGGAELCGYRVPAGTEVGINPFVLQRDPIVYENPDAFYPERWMTKDEERLRVMNRCFLAFGHGAHTCSGRWISIMETTKLIPTILLHFDLELADGARGHTVLNWWFMFQEGINVRLVPRDVEAKVNGEELAK